MQTLPTSPQVERALGEVYSRPEFAAQTRAPDVWARVRQWVVEALGQVMEWLGGFRMMQEAKPVVFWLVVAGLSIIAAALLAHLIRTGSSAFTWKRDAAPEEGATGGRRGPRTANDWEAEARRAAGEGRLRDAALALYMALVLRLDARGALRFDPAKTPGDYRREVRKDPEVARPFATFLRGFEPVAFGGRALDADGYERLRAAAGEAGARG